ncbi:MAG TPA: TIGR03435 family protein [Bryobacteraceae bacterium]
MRSACLHSASRPARLKFQVVAIHPVKLGADSPEIVVITSPRNGAAPTEVLISADGSTSRLTPYSPSGTVTLKSVTLRQLIAQAYSKEITRDEYLTGGPGWLDSDRFDLTAKAPSGSSVETERLMIQGALAERFHLVLHREQKPMEVFVLLASKTGPKLHSSAGSGSANCKGAANVTCTNVTLPELAERLPALSLGSIDRPVVDRTGIAGTYDLKLTYAVPTPEPGASPRRTPEGQERGRDVFVAAIEAQLGLKLEQQKQPMPVIVVDKADRQPTEN